MGIVQIEEKELADLRSDRDAARDETANVKRDLTAKVEVAEAEATKEKERAEALETEKKALEEKAQRAELKDKRWGALGSGFVAKLGEVTKTNLQESASALSDEAWESRLKEVEELTSVKRDATESAKEGESKDKPAETAAEGTSFSDEELARFTQGGVARPTAPTGGGVNASKALARSFAKSRQPAKAATK